MIFYCLGGNHMFALRSSMWLAHKPVHITTLIGCGEPDPVQPTINHLSLEDQDPLSSMDLGTIQKKELTPIKIQSSIQGIRLFRGLSSFSFVA